MVHLLLLLNYQWRAIAVDLMVLFLGLVSTQGDYWSSSVVTSYMTKLSPRLFFFSAGSGVYDDYEHSQGFSVRCIKN
jgi:hypothetical protein